MNMSLQVELITPKKWYQKALYKLLSAITVNGTMIPQGFISDGASIPRLFWFLIPPMGKYSKAAFLHDYLLGLAKGNKHTIRAAHRSFKAALEDDGLSSKLTYIMYHSVRIWWELKIACKGLAEFFSRGS